MATILIVDDNRELVQLVKHRLQVNQYEVIDAYDGQEGFQCALEHKPDLIIMDVQMPKMPGIEAVRQLQLDERTKHIPIIFLTGLMAGAEVGEQKRMVKVDGKEFTAFPKPFNADQLLSEIHKLLKASAI